MSPELVCTVEIDGQALQLEVVAIFDLRRAAQLYPMLEVYKFLTHGHPKSAVAQYRLGTGVPVLDDPRGPEALMFATLELNPEVPGVLARDELRRRLAEYPMLEVDPHWQDWSDVVRFARTRIRRMDSLASLECA